MHKFHLFFLLISPSPFSLVATFVCAILFVIYVNWAYLSDNPLIYRSIFGPEGFSAYVWENTGSISEWMSQFRSEEHTSELQSLMRISYAVFCLKKKKNQ